MTLRFHSRRGRAAAAALAMTLVVASCGRDDKDASTTTAGSTVASSTSAAASSTAPTATESSAAQSTTSAAPSSSAATSTTAAAPGPGDFGNLKAVCGPGDAKGSTAQGVSDSEIVVGTASDPGNTVRPGLGQEMIDAGVAFVKWCNDAGGIAGRKLKLNIHDAKLFDAGAAMVESCQTDFMLVGDGMGLDSAAVEPRVACGMPQIAAYTVSPEAGRAQGSIEALTNPDTGVWGSLFYETLQQKEPDLMSKIAFWGPNLPSTIPTLKREVAGLKQLGFDPIDYQETPSQVDNWRPFVEKLKQVDAQVLSFTNTAATLIPIMKAMDDVGYFPKYIVAPSIYEDQLIKEVGPQLDKTIVLAETKVVPFEMGATHPATKQFVDIITASSGMLRSLSVNAWSAWLLFAESATECGSNLTRDCVMEKAVAHKDWTGGGLHRPSEPGPTSQPPSQCSALLHATSKGFSLASDFYTPNTDGIFLCDPKIAMVVQNQ